jgi:hypothetical protein
MMGRRYFVAISTALALFTVTANAETIEDLKRELAAKKARISRLEQRIRQLKLPRSVVTSDHLVPQRVASEPTRPPKPGPIVSSSPMDRAPADDEGMDEHLSEHWSGKAVWSSPRTLTSFHHSSAMRTGIRFRIPIYAIPTLPRCPSV